LRRPTDSDARGTGAGRGCRTFRDWKNRGWGDCYGYVLVATGRAEIMLDPVINPWDCAPLPPILREAGGRFTTWRGEETIWGPDGVATNGALHEQVLAMLAAERRRT